MLPQVEDRDQSVVGWWYLTVVILRCWQLMGAVVEARDLIPVERPLVGRIERGFVEQHNRTFRGVDIIEECNGGRHPTLHSMKVQKKKARHHY